MPTTADQSPARFATTNWDLVRELRGPEAAAALSELCELYWFPLYAFARRKLGRDEAARDSTQAFFAWLLEKDLFQRAAAERGRLRSFLLTALQNFLHNEYQAGQRKKRGGGQRRWSLDFDEASSRFAQLPADRLTPERLYERSWALRVLQRVLARLQAEMQLDGQVQRFQALAPALAADSTANYGEIAAQLGLTEAAARQAAARLRKRYRRLLLDEVGATVGSREDVEDEIRRLFAALAPA